ncbi:MAG: hypothetical protein PF549_04875 [Patescibacteria group bacterium]|jgi:phage-related protein|nr:hypothetical protein [Patescibacteria group bacterium]
MKNLSTNSIKHIKKIWQKQGERILVFFALILVALISFNAGQTHEKSIKSAEVNMTIIEKKDKLAKKEQEIKALGEALERKGMEVPEKNVTDKETINEAENKECALIGSKNSDKYHLPTCGWADRIKPENRVCFSSEEDAKSQGYQSAGCCIDK